MLRNRPSLANLVRTTWRAGEVNTEATNDEHMHLTNRTRGRQFSAGTLFVITSLCAISLAISRFDTLLVPLAFPFTLGALAAHRATKTKYSIIIGTLSSLCCSLLCIGPFYLFVLLLAGAIGWLNEQVLTRMLLVSICIVFFGAISIVGGYLGGIAAGSSDATATAE